MLELGPDEAAFHAAVVEEALSLGVAHLFLSGPRMCEAAAAWGADARVVAASEGEQLVGAIQAVLQPGDHVLFKGSRGARVERILQGVREGTPQGAE